MKRLFALALLLLASAAAAQGYPQKPVRLLLTFSAGGQADILARAVAEKMRPSFGQQIIVEARPGAGGNLAMEATAKAAPDGYTLVLGTPAVAINGALYRKLAYDPLKDLAPLSMVALGSYVVYVSGTLPVKSAAEFIAYARARPRALNYASVGVGSGTHLAAVLFALAAGLEMSHVPYKGIQQAAPELVSGDVHLTFNALGPLTQFVQSGRIKMLAVSGAKRSPQLPDVPTLSEAGLPGFEAYGWYGLFTTAGTPREILQKLNAEIVRAVSAPDLNERIQGMNLVPAPQSLDEAAKFIAAEGVKWGRAVAVSNATAE